MLILSREESQAMARTKVRDRAIRLNVGRLERRVERDLGYRRRKCSVVFEGEGVPSNTPQAGSAEPTEPSTPR